MTRITVVDTETTGVDPEEDHPVEIAAVELDTETGELGDYRHTLVKAPIPTKLEAMAAHHISQEMSDELGLSVETAIIDTLRGGPFAAHNAPFDAGILRMTDETWLCTWRCAKHLWPDAPRYGNQVLRYWLGIETRDMPREAGNLPHRALFDTWVTAKILSRMLLEADLEELLELSQAPVVLETVGFGKHYGSKWSEIPSDYMKWILEQDFDDDTMHTARFWLGFRGYDV